IPPRHARRRRRGRARSAGRGFAPRVAEVALGFLATPARGRRLALGGNRGAAMKLWAIVGEGERRHERDLEVQVEAGRIYLETDGEKIAADVVPLPDGESYSLLVNGRSYEVAIEEDVSGLRVTLAGKTFAAQVRSPLEKVLREVRHVASAETGRKLFAP